MKKLLTLMFLLPLFAGAQVTQFIKDTTIAKAPLRVIQTAGKKDTLEINPATLNQINKATADITTLSGQVSAQAGQIINSISVLNSINGIVTMQGQQIVDLQNEVAGITTGGVVDVYDNAYTLKSSDNGKLIFVHVACTVTCPDIVPGFSCTIIRNGSGRVQVLGAKSPSSLTWINGQYRRVNVYYRTATDRVVTGDLTR